MGSAYKRVEAENARLTATLASRDALIAELREALEPFAEEADRYPRGSDWNYPACHSQFLIGEIRDAQNALARIDAMKGEDSV